MEYVKEEMIKRGLRILRVRFMKENTVLITGQKGEDVGRIIEANKD